MRTVASVGSVGIIVWTVLSQFSSPLDPGGRQILLVTIGLWVPPVLIYWGVVRSWAISRAAGVVMFALTGGLLWSIVTNDSSTAGLGYLFGHVFLWGAALLSVFVDLLVRRRSSPTQEQVQRKWYGSPPLLFGVRLVLGLAVIVLGTSRYRGETFDRFFFIALHLGPVILYLGALSTAFFTFLVGSILLVGMQIYMQLRPLGPIDETTFSVADPLMLTLMYLTVASGIVADHVTRTSAVRRGKVKPS